MTVKRTELSKDDVPNPEDYETVSSYKETFYELIEDGVPSLMLDMKLSIEYRSAHDIELTENMKRLLKDA